MTSITWLASLLLLATGCYQPSYQHCGVRCTAASGCPSDTTCGGDGFCHTSGDAETCVDPPDAGPPPDAAPPPGAAPVPRLVTNAYFGDSSGTTYASPGMTKTSFDIGTDGIQDGELVLFVASIDNGSNTVWPNPIAPGFRQITQQFYGHDGQSFVVAWKIASHEPARYTGTYGQGLGSGASVLTLIAVKNVDPTAPIDAMRAGFDPGAGINPVIGASDGVTTTRNHCIIVYASGADWLGANGTNTFEPPAGFTPLAEIGDHGNDAWDWSSQQIDFKELAVAGATGPITGSLTGTFNATAWTVVVAIAPPGSD